MWIIERKIGEWSGSVARELAVEIDIFNTYIAERVNVKKNSIMPKIPPIFLRSSDHVGWRTIAPTISLCDSYRFRVFVLT